MNRLHWGMARFSSAKPPKNDWHWLRHGQSAANVSLIIASDAATAFDNFGLSARGRQQVRHTLSRQSALNADTRVIKSDFLRAKQTALLVTDFLSSHHPLTVDKRLRARCFGDREAGSADNYEQVWQHDAVDADHNLSHVESVSGVARRLSALVDALECRFEDQTILLVSHGDPLQILECCLTGRPLTQHRRLAPLQTAQLRSLQSLS